jgi:hypothetical protein
MVENSLFLVGQNNAVSQTVVYQPQAFSDLVPNTLRANPTKKQNTLEILLDRLQSRPDCLAWQASFQSKPCSDVVAITSIPEAPDSEIIDPSGL